MANSVLMTVSFKRFLKKIPRRYRPFFVGTEEKPGFASSLNGLLENYTEKDGLIDKRIDGYENQLERLEEETERFNTKMDNYQARLFAQYNAMDALVTNMTATSNQVQGQLANLPGVVRKDS